MPSPRCSLSMSLYFYLFNYNLHDHQNHKPVHNYKQGFKTKIVLSPSIISKTISRSLCMKSMVCIERSSMLLHYTFVWALLWLCEISLRFCNDFSTDLCMVFAFIWVFGDQQLNSLLYLSTSHIVLYNCLFSSRNTCFVFIGYSLRPFLEHALSRAIMESSATRFSPLLKSMNE